MFLQTQENELSAYIYDPMGNRENDTAPAKLQTALKTWLARRNTKDNLNETNIYTNMHKYQTDSYNCGVWIAQAARVWNDWNKDCSVTPFFEHLYRRHSTDIADFSSMENYMSNLRRNFRKAISLPETISGPRDLIESGTEDRPIEPEGILRTDAENIPKETGERMQTEFTAVGLASSSTTFPPNLTRRGPVTIAQMQALINRYKLDWVVHNNLTEASACISTCHRVRTTVTGNLQKTLQIHLVIVQDQWQILLHMTGLKTVICSLLSHRNTPAITGLNLSLSPDLSRQCINLKYLMHHNNQGVLTFVAAHTYYNILSTTKYYTVNHLERDITFELNKLNITSTGPNKYYRAHRLENDESITLIRNSLRNHCSTTSREGCRGHDFNRKPTNTRTCVARTRTEQRKKPPRPKPQGHRAAHARKIKRRVIDTKCANQVFELENNYDDAGRCRNQARYKTKQTERNDTERLTRLQEAQTSNNIIIMGINMRGLRHASEDKRSLIKLETICNLILDRRADIVCISETKINNENLPLVKALMQQKGIQYRTTFVDNRATKGSMILWDPSRIPLTPSVTKVDGSEKRSVMIKFVGKKGFTLYVASAYMNDASLQDEQTEFYNTLNDWAANAGQDADTAYIEIGDKNCTLTQR